jgi:hypothetical protein
MGSIERDIQELLTWLETTKATATIRIYKLGGADEIEGIEAPLFARFGFRPIARQDYAERRIGYLLNPFQVRAVCYAR